MADDLHVVVSALAQTKRLRMGKREGGSCSQEPSWILGRAQGGGEFYRFGLAAELLLQVSGSEEGLQLVGL